MIHEGTIAALRDCAERGKMQGEHETATEALIEAERVERIAGALHGCEGSILSCGENAQA